MSIDPERPTEAQESQRDRAIVHAIESALLVNRHYQFFVWCCLAHCFPAALSRSFVM